jgi:hypothetical protein
VYVSDTAVDVNDPRNHRIQKFDSNGKFITKWGSYGSGDGQFVNSPDGTAVDSSGYAYVSDSYKDSIQVFAPASTTNNK